MIDEKKLIEAIVNTPSKHQDDCCLEFLEGMATRQHEILDIINEQPKADWIPCKERLPEKRGNYLVCSKGVTWVANWFLNTWWGIEKRCRYSDVEAWSILPQPYKEEGAE